MKTKKYWYRTEIRSCVLCGVEKKGRHRVYNKENKGLHIYDDACAQHF